MRGHDPFSRAIAYLVAIAGWAWGLAAERSAPEFDRADLVTGWALVVGGAIVISRGWRAFPGWLLAASGFLWFAPEVGLGGTYWHRAPLLHVALLFPGGAVALVDAVAVAIAYGVSAVDAPWQNLRVSIVLAVLFVAAAMRRHQSAVAGERRSRRVGLAVTATYSAAISLAAMVRLIDANARASARSVYQPALALVAGFIAYAAVVRPWERVTVTDLVVDIGSVRTDTLRDSLADALGDPHLEIGYPLESGEIVDGAGRPIFLLEVGAQRVATPVVANGATIAVLVHHRALSADPALVEALQSAARLAATNARLRAEVEQRIAEVEASRRRLVLAEDGEQQRLQARLEVGAEHRLVTLDARFAAAASEPAAGQLLAGVRDDLAAAIVELRSLAAGLHPRLLEERGLVGALAELAAGCPLPVTLDTEEEVILPPEVESALYFLCSEALANTVKHASASHGWIVVGGQADTVFVEVSDDGRGGADPDRGRGLRDLADRIGALGGRLAVVSPAGGGTRLTATLPVDR